MQTGSATLRGRTVVNHPAKFFAALSTAITTAWNGMPGAVRDLALVATVFIVLDTLTGLWCAAVCRAVRSRKLSEGLVTKAAQYAILVGLAGGAALLAHNWGPLIAGLSAIVAIEAVSMLENLARLERHGGVNLGPARPLIQRLQKYLAAEPEAEAGKGERHETR